MIVSEHPKKIFGVHETSFDETRRRTPALNNRR
jgi:hypothetical protein